MRAVPLVILVLVAVLTGSTHAAFPTKSEWCLRGGCSDPPVSLLGATTALESKVFGSSAVSCGDGVCNVVAGEHCLSCPSDCGKCGLTAPVVRCRNSKHAALSFDDGPGPYTETLVNTLNSLKVKATFFVIGDTVMKNPQLHRVIKAAMSAGHDIGLHTYTHRSLGGTGRMDPPVAGSRGMTAIEVRAEALFNDLAVQNAIGVRPRFLRLPFLEYTSNSMAVLDTLGYVPVSVNIDSSDWRVAMLPNTTADMIASNVASGMRSVQGSGIIILQHDTLEKSTLAIPQIVSSLQASGYTLVSMSTCLGLPGYRGPADSPILASRFAPESAKLLASEANKPPAIDNSTLASNNKTNAVGDGANSGISSPQLPGDNSKTADKQKKEPASSSAPPPFGGLWSTSSIVAASIACIAAAMC
ncbi:hypothetical protein BC828DRAFT_390775 [Blastocladiella britannica]|nr:hypothetical protein BC828DRAFT_390775 [Blastocladiella britannica]